MLKAVIIAAGKGVRMKPLTSSKPKPLLEVLGKSIIEHSLENLFGIVKEVILVVGCNGEMIKKQIGENYKGIKINYVWQEEQLGTGDAALRALKQIDDRFILLNGDDLYSKTDIKNCFKKFPCILLSKVENPSAFGVVNCNKDHIRRIEEKPESVEKDALVNTGFYYLDKSIFDYKISKSSRNEYEFTDYIKAFILNKRLYYKIAERWLPSSYPWDLLKNNEIFLEEIKNKNKGKIEKGVTISGKVIIEKNVIIKNGTRIEGPVYIKSGAIVGPNAFIRGKTIIGESSFIGTGVEIKNSIIGKHTKISHLNYVGDSIIGERCNLGAGSICANYRFDGKTIRVLVKDEMKNTGRLKFGAVIGDGAMIGVNSSLMPGVLIGANSIIGPNLVIKRNIEDGEIKLS